MNRYSVDKGHTGALAPGLNKEPADIPAAPRFQKYDVLRKMGLQMTEKSGLQVFLRIGSHMRHH